MRVYLNFGHYALNNSDCSSRGFFFEGGGGVNRWEFEADQSNSSRLRNLHSLFAFFVCTGETFDMAVIGQESSHYHASTGTHLNLM